MKDLKRISYFIKWCFVEPAKITLLSSLLFTFPVLIGITKIVLSDSISEKVVMTFMVIVCIYWLIISIKMGYHLFNLDRYGMLNKIRGDAV